MLRTSLRRALYVVGGLSLFVAGWYLVSRATSPLRAARIYEISSTASRPGGAELRVATFNIAHGRGGAFGASNWQGRSEAELLAHLRALGQQIRAAEADLVLLQEVDFSSAWSRHVNQAEVIAREAGLRHVAEQPNVDLSLPFFTLRFGNAVLSRFPLRDAERIDLPPFSRWEDLAVGNHDALQIVAETPLGSVGVVALHLDYRSEEVRVEAADAMLQHLDSLSIPLVVAGDLNSSPRGHPESRRSAQGRNAMDLFLAEGFASALPTDPAQAVPTFPSEAPRVTIDWILTRGLGPVQARVVHSDLSDHLMVVAALRTDRGDNASNASDDTARSPS